MEGSFLAVTKMDDLYQILVKQKIIANIFCVMR